MEWLDYENVRQELNQFMPSLGDLFLRIFSDLIQGADMSVLKDIPQMIGSVVQKNVSDLSGTCFTLLLLGLLSSVLTHVTAVFKEKGIGEAAFYFCYLCGAGVLISLYFTMVETAVSLIRLLVGFTEVIIPVFYFAVAMTREIQTAAGFYQMNMLLLYAVEVIIPEVVVPIVSAYVYLSVLSGLSPEDIFAGFLRFIQKGLAVLQKSALLVISGVGVMKKMLHGATDGMNLAIWQKTFGAIPAVGDLSESVTGIMIGSSVLIKNGLGISVLAVVLLLVLTPVLKLLIIAVMLQLIAAFVTVFGDKRFSFCVERVSAGGFMLLKSCICCISIFMVVIALVCVAV